MLFGALRRVSVAVDCNGGVTRVYFSKKPISTRGTRVGFFFFCLFVCIHLQCCVTVFLAPTYHWQFAMPMPRGGRNDPGDIVLTEDDLIRKTRNACYVVKRFVCVHISMFCRISS